MPSLSCATPPSASGSEEHLTSRTWRTLGGRKYLYASLMRCEIICWCVHHNRLALALRLVSTVSCCGPHLLDVPVSPRSVLAGAVQESYVQLGAGYEASQARSPISSRALCSDRSTPAAFPHVLKAGSSHPPAPPLDCDTHRRGRPLLHRLPHELCASPRPPASLQQRSATSSSSAADLLTPTSPPPQPTPRARAAPPSARAPPSSSPTSPTAPPAPSAPETRWWWPRRGTRATSRPGRAPRARRRGDLSALPCPRLRLRRRSGRAESAFGCCHLRLLSSDPHTAHGACSLVSSRPLADSSARRRAQGPP